MPCWYKDWSKIPMPPLPCVKFTSTGLPASFLVKRARRILPSFIDSLTSSLNWHPWEDSCRLLRLLKRKSSDRASPAIILADAFARWDAQCAIPPGFYDKLARYSPFCELYTRCPGRNDTARALQLLQDSTQLVALEVMLEFAPYTAQYHALIELRKALKACTKLEKLQVSCSSFPNAPSAGFRRSFSLTESHERLPPLKVLKLREVTLADYSKDGWERCIQWEALESLHCTEIEFFPKMSTSLKQLRSLGVHLSNDVNWTFEQGDVVLDLASTSSKLEELCLTGMTAFLRSRDFLSRRNTSLKHIKIHENQAYGEDGDVVRSTLDVEDIKKLGNSYPRLERCSIDLQIGSDWVRASSIILCWKMIPSLS